MDQTKDNNPLVSIIVITYNSNKFVLETLESIKAQTYKNIELIISDDYSTDNTLNICINWIKENKERFIRTELIKTKKNTGIAANNNRGLLSAKGEWVKNIAGDDILFPSCIFDNIEFTQTHSNAKFIFSKYRYLINGKISPRYYFRRSFFRKNNSQQYKCLLKEVGVNSPTSFMSRIDLINLGGFNEKFPFLEDAPLWLKASSKGYMLYGLDSFTVIYRIHSENSCLSNGIDFINKNYYSSKKNFYNQIVKIELKKHKKYITLFSNFIDFMIKDCVISKGNRKSDYNLKLKLLNTLNINRLIGLNGYFNKHNDFKI
jgi:glycosyltransferase involved in cell wall biosynthesis